MAEKTIVVNLPYGLAPNTLPGMSGYRFVPSHVGSADGEQVFARVAANNPGISAAIARLVHETKCGVVADVIAEYQYRVVMPHETYELVLPGSTDSVDGAPTKPVCVAVRLADDMRRAAAGLAPAYSDATGETVKIRAEEDLETRTQGQIVGCNPFRLAGSDLSASGEGEGIVVVSATGQKAEAEIVEENCRGAHVTARLVTALPPGKGTVMLSTRGWSTPEGELRTMSKSVTILAGATPPEPTPPVPTVPTVTAINDGRVPRQPHPDQGRAGHGHGGDDLDRRRDSRHRDTLRAEPRRGPAPHGRRGVHLRVRHGGRRRPAGHGDFQGPLAGGVES